MVRARRLLLVCIAVLVASVVAEAAPPWPATTEVLRGWDGARVVTLRSPLSDPMGSPDVQELLALLLAEGYRVVPGPVDAPAGEGLILDLRFRGEVPVLAVRRAADGAVLSFESGAPARASAPSTVAVPLAGRVAATTISLDAPALSVAAFATGANGALEAVLQFDDRVALVRWTGGRVEEVTSWSVPVRPSRAVRVSSGDLDGDGVPEVAVVWVEDVQGIYDGVDSRLHGWVLGWENGRWVVRSPDLKAFLRFVGGRLYAQARGRHELHAGPVRAVEAGPDGYRLAPDPVPWPEGEWLLSATPLAGGEWIAWRDGRRPALLVADGKPLAGGTVPDDLGASRGPEVAVRLETPEFRSGFEKEDRVYERFLPVPRRVVVAGDGRIYAVRFGRALGVPLVGAPSGADAVVRIVRDGNGLRVERPYPPVEAFVLDFALFGDRVLLLLNDKADGSSKGYLSVLGMSTQP